MDATIRYGTIAMVIYLIKMNGKGVIQYLRRVRPLRSEWTSSNVQLVGWLMEKCGHLPEMDF